MQTINLITDIGQIETRLRLAGSTTGALLEAAGIHPSTWRRWKAARRSSAAASGRADSWRRLHEALEGIEKAAAKRGG